MGLSEVIRATLRALELVEVRGRDNRRALDVAVSNLEAIVEALDRAKDKARDKAKEAKAHDADDGQGQGV